MSIKDWCILKTAQMVSKNQLTWGGERSSDLQHNIMTRIITSGENTKYWEEKGIHDIRNYLDFKEQVPIVTYEDIKPYIDRMWNGESDVLWIGKPSYFAETSGTTSGVKYIPIFSDYIDNYISGAKFTLMHYINSTHNTKFLDGKMMFITGTPKLKTTESGIPYGRLSGISNHMVPSYLKGKQVPSFETNCIEDFEKKIDAIIDETYNQDLRFLSGIPPWIQMYFDKLYDKYGKKIIDLFPNLSVILYGGMRFEPYYKRLIDSVGKDDIDLIETYATSEGYIACQTSKDDKGMLLQIDNDIFYEFIPVENINDDPPERVELCNVEMGKDYAIVISNTSGLLGYVLGDTVRFTSLNPYRIIITGRTKHFTSAFGEHVILEEVENAMSYALERHSEVRIYEYTVAPHIGGNRESSYHEWAVEFITPPNDIKSFENDINEKMMIQNEYYKNLIDGRVLQPLHILYIKRGCFDIYLKEHDQYGEQHKIQRLSNDRKMIDELLMI